MAQPSNSSNGGVPFGVPASSTGPVVAILYTPYVYKPSRKRRDVAAEQAAGPDPWAWHKAVEQGRQAAMKKMDWGKFLERQAVMYPEKGQWRCPENSGVLESQAQEGQSGRGTEAVGGNPDRGGGWVGATGGTMYMTICIPMSFLNPVGTPTQQW
ncbi:hypothetical protein DFH07DRAFT_826330 [Mycena maculata]|uniref:Uncharacterized protein n=1 Tax=Mycena maculata TaxID=230809 RepID=A0AAD7NAG9_9AGAR|nr:hypothetical protein DFH07DRAFT_826330 [Mycena maculata]